MKEKEFINLICDQFDRSPKQLNVPHESDSEIIEVSGQLLAITTDEFSKEDCFGDLTAEQLGWNMAVATISDLFAVGSNPCFYTHAISFDGNPSFIKEFSQGVSKVLTQTGAFLIGGDLGHAESLRYCATAIGTLPTGKFITRVMKESVEQELWVTGRLGDANLSVFLNNPAPVFECRLPEAEFIRKHATACIDTSGGLIDALWALKEVNLDFKFDFTLASIPFDPKVVDYCDKSGVPPMAFLYGGAGEYELLFTVPENTEVTIKATKIGLLTAGHGLFVDGQEIDEAPPCPRSFTTIKDYTKEVMRICL